MCIVCVMQSLGKSHVSFDTSFVSFDRFEAIEAAKIPFASQQRHRELFTNAERLPGLSRWLTCLASPLAKEFLSQTAVKQLSVSLAPRNLLRASG